VNANKFFVALQAALGTASVTMTPYLTGLQVAYLAVANAFVGALVVYKVSNDSKPAADG
jgi:hypothetical protein